MFNKLLLLDLEVRIIDGTVEKEDYIFGVGWGVVVVRSCFVGNILEETHIEEKFIQPPLRTKVKKIICQVQETRTQTRAAGN